MSTNVIDEMTEHEAKELLNDICNRFSIGGKARSRGVVLANVENAFRRSQCLSKIEQHHTITELDDDGEEMENSLLNWGETPEQYIATYRGILGA